MKRRLWYLVIGVSLLVSGIMGITSGKALGFGTIVSSNRYVTFGDNPIEYTLSLLFSFAVGGGCIWAFFFERNSDESGQ